MRSAKDGTYISDVYLGFRGKPHFIIAVARKAEGRPWVLRASVDPQKFAEFVGRSHLIEDAETFIVDRQGKRQTLLAEAEIGRAFPMPAKQGGKTVLAEASVEGAMHLGAVAPLRTNDWSLVMMVPKKRAYAPILRAQIVVGALVLLGVVLVVALSLRSTQRLVRELEQADTDRGHLTQQLFDAAKLASVGEMAAGVAHEINNPLAIVYETAGLMKDTLDPAFGQELDPDRFRELLDTIEQATLRGRNVTRQLLAFARRHEPEPVPLDAAEQIRQVLAVKESAFRVSNIEVVTELAPALPPVLCDATQLEQVLLNLLNNARDAIGSGGRITVRTRRQGRMVAIEVQDTGCGMTREQMNRAFFPFYTTKAVGRGTGLGLSISYGIVKAHGGRIEVESEVGVGTTFVMTLPAVRGLRARPSSPGALPPGGGRER
ncbi:MAG: two-component sensor histidine kinase [Deltaproteobacteria bacterium]|nr:two-component sensor histidine kinase [Deltaproteobacteria bacterium]